ncbi:MAG: class I SAM-dependent methyltransferase [Nostoc sp. ChiSLP02]|nr:class I SAM-dependent methyltransferase [Nostoc sp. DedSLP05]MDZ8099420.1 class I SAM-dependent methyltransferase [Nostoc sp. DedSLP01]MDZ8184580.1 class I SAM-dependent methyltransferase [Nostoc sp. ChiSLP02]
MSNEIEAIRQRYHRRQQIPEASLYDPLHPSRYMLYQEKRHALIRWINWANLAPVGDKRLLEIGCGSGNNLSLFMSLGFQPENLVGNELIEDYALNARRLLPTSTEILVGDASTLKLDDNSFDIVFQSTVFTSILDKNFQQKLANRMWSLVKPGGGVLWYDFIFDNPKNPDVKGVSKKQIRQLFPEGNIKTWQLSLAPPISRRVTKIHPNLYSVFNLLPFLRTHVLCWITKS